MKTKLFDVSITYLRSEKYTGVLEAKDENDLRNIIAEQAKSQGLLRPQIESIKVIPEDELNFPGFTEEPAPENTKLN